MPFPVQPSLAYDLTQILRIKPGQIGVYGIFRSNKCVYIGTGDIRARLRGHIEGDKPSLDKLDPTHFFAIKTSDFESRAKGLIAELNPVCNRKV